MSTKFPNEVLLAKALAVYAGDHVLAHVLETGERGLVPYQESRELTVLFVDIASFTEPPGGILSEKIPEWQTAYLEALSEPIKECKGILDIFIGDSASAWWDRSRSPDHARLACEAAVEMLQRVGNLNKIAASRGYPIVTLKIGINTGIAAIGAYGTASRLRFSIVGDAVNLASRLCGLSGSKFQGRIVLSEGTRERLPGNIDVSLLDRLPIKGKQELMSVFTLQAPKDK